MTERSESEGARLNGGEAVIPSVIPQALCTSAAQNEVSVTQDSAVAPQTLRDPQTQSEYHSHI